MSPGLQKDANAVVVIVGSGGRESALAWKLSQSPNVRRILLVPGNGYTASFCSQKISNGFLDLDNLSLENPAHFSRFSDRCKTEKVSLVVIGPEAPLAAGLADHLNREGIACFGPHSQAAKLEWDKSFAKSFFDKHGIPTARWKSFTKSEKAVKYINSATFDALVVKASGLAAGKGVVVCSHRQEACQTACDILDNKCFGEAGSSIVVEEKLDGPEVSVLCFTDGETVVAMPAAQDAKRVGEGDTGPNTGGMGAYIPVHPSILSHEGYQCIVHHVNNTVKGLRVEGCPYVGVLYAGVILTRDGPKFLEYNCRFGDPETEVLLPLLESDLYEVLLACTNGSLSETTVKFSTSKAAVCVVLASEGYPNATKTGKHVDFGRDVRNFTFSENALIFPAGIVNNFNELKTNGGRVLMVVGTADDLHKAAVIAQNAAQSIKFDGKQYRKDIGYQSIVRSLTSEAGLTYKDCDVDIDEGDRLVNEYIVPEAKQTDRAGLLHGVGGFGGLFDLTQLNYKNPVIVSGTDGVGTKLLIAEDCGKHETVGIDLVAMSVNDILTHNAEPVLFLDYFATGKLSTEIAGLVLKGIAAGCKESNCSLIGGETAEMPGMYPPGRYDLAGFAVGIAEKDQILPRIATIVPGDLILGVASSGIHSNGFSLVRRVVKDSGADYDIPAPFNQDSTLGDALLVSTKLYVKSVLPALRSGKVKAASHITGGGLTENIPRILPKNTDAVLEASSWPVLPVFSWLWSAGGVAPLEMARTFNLGIGMTLIVSPECMDDVLSLIKDSGDEVFVIGKVTEGTHKVKINGLESALLSSYMSWAAKSVDVKSTEKMPALKKVRVGIMISGSGTNMEALVAHSRNPRNKSMAEVVLVVSNKASAAGVEKAKKLGIAVQVVDHRKYGDDRAAYDNEINRILLEHGVEMVCLAGYMRICSTVFVDLWRGCCINTHPALLPSFKGKDAVGDALKEGVCVSGCSVHFVEEKVDAGGIILQAPVHVCPLTDTHDTLSERIKKVEHQIFPLAMEAVCRGDAKWASSEGAWKVQWNNFDIYHKLLKNLDTA